MRGLLACALLWFGLGCGDLHTASLGSHSLDTSATLDASSVDDTQEPVVPEASEGEGRDENQDDRKAEDDGKVEDPIVPDADASVGVRADAGVDAGVDAGTKDDGADEEDESDESDN